VLREKQTTTARVRNEEVCHSVVKQD